MCERAIRSGLLVLVGILAWGCAEGPERDAVLEEVFDYYRNDFAGESKDAWRPVSVSAEVRGADVHVRVVVPPEAVEKNLNPPGPAAEAADKERLASLACPPKGHRVWALLGEGRDVRLSLRKGGRAVDFVSDASCRELGA